MSSLRESANFHQKKKEKKKRDLMFWLYLVPRQILMEIRSGYDWVRNLLTPGHIDKAEKTYPPK